MSVIYNSTEAFLSPLPIDPASRSVGLGAVIEASSAFLWTLTAIVGASLLAWFRKPWTDENGHKIPKGPIGLPIFGSFYSLTRYPELTLDYWAKRFGDLYSIWLGNQLFVIVSDPNIAKDLMVTNGNVFSSRKECLSKAKPSLLVEHRRIAATWLSQRVVDSYSPVLDRESLSLVKALLIESKGGLAPVDPQPYAGRCSLNNMTTITFGFRADSIHHPLVGRALKPSREFMNCTGPMSNLIDFVPILQYLPTPLHRRAKKLHKGLVETYGGFIKETEQKMMEGKTVQDCLAKTMVEVRYKEELDDLDMAILASAFMIGGVETTAAIMQWFSALIPAYPEIQKKAQEELDRVIGRDRLPAIEDEKNLPYCHAIIKEVERVHNPFWLGTPHVASEDFVYQGKFIPKDTVVVLNTWTMHYDPARHSSPKKFDCQCCRSDEARPLDVWSWISNSLSATKQKARLTSFSRRVCPGMIVAEREIWLTISRMLWAFDMYEIPGEPIDLKEYDGLSGRSPVPFRIGLKPRHDNVAKLLEKVEI
ncbi:unnamed protein product [Penicillium egyptiacum]|uniref:Cytochrome P450 n=1 Tax=Penicillium egyptiacum TaxID=1303716 RepID=A0A9W4P0I1_9EURO|nr:unnamed protein product [Penicillium egyptiacum]